MIPVLVVATERNKRVELLERSFLAHKGWDLRVLGVGQKWESFRTKMELYCQELRRIKPDQVVVCLDAYDAVCARDSDGLIDTFRKLDAPVVAGYESVAVPTIYNKWIRVGMAPAIDKWKAHHNISARGVFVNSGCVVGGAGDVLNVWEWILAYEEFAIDDDQIGVGCYMNEFPEKVKLDTGSRIVWNDHMFYNTKMEERGDKLIVPEPEEVPYFIHFPGLKGQKGGHADRYRKVAAFVVGDDSIMGEDVGVPTDRWWVVVVVPVVVVVVVVVAMLGKMILRRQKPSKKKQPS